jgi:hypothetical protein
MAADQAEKELAILDELAKLAQRLTEAEARCSSLREYRGRLLVEARSLDRPVSWSRLSSACGLTDPSTIKAYNKALSEAEP